MILAGISHRTPSRSRGDPGDRRLRQESGEKCWLVQTVWKYRWPLLPVGILSMGILANVILVRMATRADAPRVMPGFFERSREWDREAALAESSRRLGWTVAYDVPAGPPYEAAGPRPVDVRVTDREGAGVTGLQGRLIAVRPADPALNRAGDLVELPHEPGRYRALIPMQARGLWELRLDARRSRLRFVHSSRLDVPGGGTIR